MTRNLVLSIIVCVLLSFALATICQLAFPDILPYAVGKDEAPSWRPHVAFSITASAFLAVEVAGILTIIFVARLWKRSSVGKV
jgi:hypothetical protein